MMNGWHIGWKASCLVGVDSQVGLFAAGSFTMDERMAMVDSLRSATKNTSFERWLEATMQPLQPAASSSPLRVLRPTPPPPKAQAQGTAISMGANFDVSCALYPGRPALPWSGLL